MFESEIFKQVNDYRQMKRKDNESGGILIGEYRDDHLRITGLTKPGFLDIQNRCFFDRKSPHHQSDAFQCWVKSNHTQTWIGEWHTHPEDHPQPSSIDIGNWKEKLPNRHMVLLIQGRVSRWCGLWTGVELVKL